jgi:hypothetical protein
MHSIKRTIISFEEVIERIKIGSQQKIINEVESANSFLISEASLYEEKMKSNGGHELKQFNDFPKLVVTEDRLKSLYKNKLVNGNGRALYDKILIEAKRDTCCFCSYYEPDEIDHFLPKSKYAHYAITPVNLVPICHRCNKKKGEFSPDSRTKNMIHPYFENFDDKVWLEAQIYFNGNSPVAKFNISDKELSKEEFERLNNHLDTIDLFARYSYQSAREFSGIARKYRRLFDKAGKQAVIVDVLETAHSYAKYHENSWQSVLYRAMYKNDRFVRMEWDLV